MDITPLMQSGNIWLIAIGIGVTLLLQWAKAKFLPTTPAPNAPNAPVPVPAPSGHPVLDALLAFLKTRLLSGVAAPTPTSFGEGPVAPAGPKANADHAAASKLMGLMNSTDL